jgi:hypothetical protein
MPNPHEFQPKTTVIPNHDGVHCGDCRLQCNGGDWCHCYSQKLEGAGWRHTNDADDPQSIVWHEAERCDTCLADERFFVLERQLQEAIDHDFPDQENCRAILAEMEALPGAASNPTMARCQTMIDFLFG